MMTRSTLLDCTTGRPVVGFSPLPTFSCRPTIAYPTPYFASSFILSGVFHGIQTENCLPDHCAITCQSDTGDRAHLQGICKSIRNLEARLCIWDLSVYVCRRTARRRAALPG